MKTSPSLLTLAAASLAAVGAAGCVNALVMDTGRSLPPGETTVTSGFGAGWQRSEITGYVKEEEVSDPETGVVVTPERRTEFPLTPFQFEWFYRWSRGAGAGFQVDWAFTIPTPAGLGGYLGLKWELPLPGEVVAAALVARAGANASGTQSAGAGGIIANGSADPGIIVSLHPFEHHAVYLSPRVRWDVVYSQLWSDDGERSFTRGARSWSGAIGWKVDGMSLGALLFEVQTIYTPDVAEDGLRVIVGFSRVQRF